MKEIDSMDSSPNVFNSIGGTLFQLNFCGWPVQKF